MYSWSYTLTSSRSSGLRWLGTPRANLKTSFHCGSRQSLTNLVLRSCPSRRKSHREDCTDYLTAVYSLGVTVDRTSVDHSGEMCLASYTPLKVTTAYGSLLLVLSTLGKLLARRTATVKAILADSDENQFSD